MATAPKKGMKDEGKEEDEDEKDEDEDEDEEEDEGPASTKPDHKLKAWAKNFAR